MSRNVWPLPGTEGQPSIQDNGWFNRSMRWMQLTLAENDPGRFDLGFWLDYLKRTHIDCASFSAGGYVAYYPTQIPLHYRSAWLEDLDPFGDLVTGCREMGIRVIARTDPHAVHQEVFDAHPEWIAVDAQGQKRRHWSCPDAWVTCALGPYNFWFMTEVHKEIMALYQVDAIFSNRWAGHGICYCEHCQLSFRTAHGLDLPRARDPRDEAYRKYLLWRQDRLFELSRLWNSEIREINPDSYYIPNSGGGALSGLDMRRLGEQVPFLFADRQGRSGLMPPWANGKNAKEFRAGLGRKPVIGICNVGVTERYRWKDSVQNGAEYRIWMAEAIANGMRPRFSKFCGVLHDTRWPSIVEDIFNWHHQVERYLRNEASLARVAMVYSQQTAAFYGGERAREKVEDHTLGMYHALVEARIPFEMVHDRLLDPEHIGQYRTLILPNIAALSDEQCEQIRDYVARGGSIVATFETSLYDEWGVQRENFGLSDLFGVEYAGEMQGPMLNSYLLIEDDPTTGVRHALLAGLKDAQRIINGVFRLHVTAREEFPNPPLTLVPPYPDLPMEEVYPRVPRTDVPEVYLRELGEGRIVYFPWDIDRTFWEVMNVDHGKLLQHAVEWATGEERPVTVTGPGVLDVTIWRQTDSMTVHLVNLTNPMMMKGPFRELMPVGEQRVCLRLPSGKTAKRVQLLRAGEPPQIEQIEGRLTVLVPTILDHEVVAIDLE